MAYDVVCYRPDADLVGNSDDLPENVSGVELDDVLLPRNLDEILQNEVWANDAAYAMPIFVFCRLLGIHNTFFKIF